jgi:hypothetical protein
MSVLLIDMPSTVAILTDISVVIFCTATKRSENAVHCTKILIVKNCS